MSSLELRVATSLGDVDEREWNALVDPDRHSPFLDYRWLSALEKTQCVGPESGWIPSHFLVYRGKELVALAPAYVKDNSEGEFVYDFSWAELYRRVGEEYYPKIVFGIPFTPAQGARFVTRDPESRGEILKTMLGGARSLSREIEGSSIHVLFPHREEAEELGALGCLIRYGVQYHFHNRAFGTFEDFLKTLPSKKRTQLRRERKQLAIDGVVVRELESGELPASADAMFRFYASTVRKFQWQKRYLNAAFFREIAKTMPDALSWITAEKDGVSIAGAFNLKSKTTRFGRYWGATTELPFLHFNVCYYDGVERCIREGQTIFEPGAGGEHKRVRGFAPTVTYSAHIIENERLRPLFVDFLAREREAIERYVASGGSGEEPE